MSYDKIVLGQDEQITLNTDKVQVSSDESADITATLKNVRTEKVYKRTIYFYKVDEAPEPHVNGTPFVSMNGELICDEYLPEGNPVNPESSFGWFIYMIIGGGFDRMDEMTNQFLIDCDIISANPKSLDKFYGVSLNLPRPTIVENTVERLLTDKEYAAYLYIRNSQLLTRLDLLSVFGHCMGNDSFEDHYHGVTVTDEKNAQWQTVDHLHYNSPDNPSSNISKNSDADMNHIVNQGSEEDVYTIPGETTYTGELVTYVNVPAAGWSQAFLDFLTDFISIKGNVLVREVIK